MAPQKKGRAMIDDEIPAVEEVDRPKASLGNGSTTKMVGSGVSTTKKAAKMIPLDELSSDDVSRLSPLAWTENQTMISSLFGEIYQRSQMCPGRDTPQCCGAANEDAYCTPNWREREDPEWYAQEINKYLSVVNLRAAAGSTHDPRSVADDAFELGCLVTEALIKFRWDRHAKRGQTVVKAAAFGGLSRRNSSRGRLTAEETIAAVDAAIGPGKDLMSAYRAVAKAQGVSDQTIRKEYRRNK